MFSRRSSRARRRPTATATILIATVILGALTVLGIAVYTHHLDVPWTKRVGAEVHL